MHSSSIEIMLDPRNLKVFKSYRKTVKGQMTKLDPKLKYYIGQFEPSIFSVLKLCLFLKLQSVKSYRNKMQGSNDKIRPAQIPHWTLNHALFLY